jgi:nicotinamide-nucleotide amidase
LQAEIVSVGTELLLGEIVDTNAAHIARALRDIGLDVIYKSTVGDNEQRIAVVIRHALERVDVVIVNGGLGPTVDDVTREGIARATGRPLEFRPELFEQIAARFRRFGAQMSENNRRQAFVPHGATPIENPVGTAPAFILETEAGIVITLPGVPGEMKYLLEGTCIPWLRERMGQPAIIKARVLRTAGIGESRIDQIIGDLMTAANPTVGLAAHSGQTDVRITAKAATPAEADALIAPVEAEVRRRLGDTVYGVEDERLEETLVALLAGAEATIAAIEAGTGGLLAQRLADASKGKSGIFVGHISADGIDGLAGFDLDSDLGLASLAEEAARHVRGVRHATYGMAVVIRPGEPGDPTGGTAIAFAGPEETRSQYFAWSTERADAPTWATTHALALARRVLLKIEE